MQVFDFQGWHGVPPDFFGARVDTNFWRGFSHAENAGVGPIGGGENTALQCLQNLPGIYNVCPNEVEYRRSVYGGVIGY